MRAYGFFVLLLHINNGLAGNKSIKAISNYKTSYGIGNSRITGNKL